MVVRKNLDEIMQTPKKRMYWIARISQYSLGLNIDAEDILSQCCIRALRAKRYDTHRKFDAWFAMVVKTVTWRYTGNRRRLLTKEIDTEPEFWECHEETATSDPDVPGYDVDLWSIIETSLDRLPSDQRVLLVAFHLHDMSVTDLAEKYDCGVQSMRVKLQMARQALKEMCIDQH